MARLSVEHHPEGPGDQYGRKRKNHKRTRSSASSKREASPRPQTPKRAKRAQADDHEQLAREMQDSVSRSQDTETRNTVAVAVAVPKARRRNSEPLAAQDNDNAQVSAAHPASQPALGTSRPPKPQRQARMSMPAQLHPTEEEEETNEVQFEPLRAQLDPRTHRRLRRSHLSEELNEFEEHKKQDSKRAKELSELRRQLHEREEQIKGLEYNLEIRRLGEIDISDETAELEEELRRAKEENEQLKASMAFTPTPSPLDAPQEYHGDGLIDDDNDAFGPFDDEDENVEPDAMYSASQATKTNASRTFVSSRITLEESSQAMLDYDMLAEASQVDPASIPEKVSDQAVKRYEMEIEQIKAQLSQTESILRIVGINMQNLQVLPAGAKNDDILTTLRHTFEVAREELEKLFPGSTAELTNGELVPTLLDHLHKMAIFIKEKVTRIHEYKEEVQGLQSDRDAVLDKLSTAEIRIGELDHKLRQVDHSNEQNERRIVELQDEISTQQRMVHDQNVQMDEKDARIHGLEDELDDKDTALERLREAYKKAEDEVNKLTRTVTLLEEEYAASMAQMEKFNAEAVAKLQDELKDEQEARAHAEDEATQKSDYIDELENRLEGMSATVDDVKSDIDRLQQLYSTEKTTREAIEKDLDQQTDLANEHANTIESLNETIGDLEKRIEELGTNLDAERKQREQTEGELEHRNQEITNLNAGIHDAGIRANELRSKLFELQQKHEQEVKDIEAQAKTIEDNLRQHLEVEMKDRRDAEEQVADLSDKTALLENALQGTENSLDDMTRNRDELMAERDAQVAKLNKQVDNLTKKITALEAAHKTTIDGLQTTITDLNNEISVQKLRIQELEEAAEVAAGQHAGELAQRDATVADLQTDLDTAREENETLKEENNSLAKRVEHEASELLNIMGAHAEETNALRKTIDIQKATIGNLEDAAKQRTEDHEANVTSLEAQIEELQTVADTRAEYIARLIAHKDDLEATFRAREEENQKTIDKLNESLRELLSRNEELTEENRQRGEEALNRLSQMKAEGLEIKSKTVDLRKVANGRVTKVNEKIKIGKKKSGRSKVVKRQWGDSGVGMDDAFEAEDEGMMAEGDEGVVG